MCYNTRRRQAQQVNYLGYKGRQGYQATIPGDSTKRPARRLASEICEGKDMAYYVGITARGNTGMRVKYKQVLLPALGQQGRYL